MFKQIAQKINLYIMRILDFFRNREKSINIVEALQSPSHILICLPREPEGLQSAQRYLVALSALYPETRVTLLLSKAQNLFDKAPANFVVVAYGSDDRNAIGGLADRVKNQLLATPVDIAIDMNRTFDFLSTSIIWASKAPLRICFAHPERENLYNFIIRLSENSSWDKAIQTLITYLSARGNQIEIPQPAL